MPTKEFKKYNQTIEKLKRDGWCVFKKMTIIEDDDYPDKWHVLSVWRDSDYVSLTLVFDWQRGDGYYFMTNMYGKLRGTVLPKRLKFYEVYNVKSYLRGCFPYLNTAKKFAERLEEKVVCTKSDKIFEHVENDDFFHVVDAFLGGFAAYAYYVNREKECVIVGEYGAFVDWMKKHKYPMRKPEWFKENEACDYSILEPDVDFEYF